MNAYYYTFGSDMRFPYQGGWVQVFAETSEKADAIFRKYFPDRHPGILNCAAIYAQENFPKSMLINGNLGKYCHKVLGSAEGKKTNWLELITERLKNQAKDSFWCDDNGQIMVPTESAANAIADMLELLYLSEGEEKSVNSTYYEPEEDVRDGVSDEYTGWWCVTIE